jgi:hypothetical protein
MRETTINRAGNHEHYCFAGTTGAVQGLFSQRCAALRLWRRRRRRYGAEPGGYVRALGSYAGRIKAGARKAGAS